jgi:glycosyltransferase involved in cell wall biosynthesis
MKPLVSILIPAYNSEEWIAESLQSVVRQTWERKEVIVVDDGSRDRTAEIARSFAAKNVKVVSTENQGLSAAVNNAYRICQGDYIQELDSDDLISPNKIELQLSALRESDTKRIMLSSPWGHFYYRHRRARFVRNSLWNDLSPADWLSRKMGDNFHMQNATWLVSRELAEAAGPWDESLRYDQDGEYFSRVLAHSHGVRFVEEGRVYYRLSGTGQLSYVRAEDHQKQDSLLVSIKLHIKYLRSLEESERVRKTCLAFLQTKSIYFYPARPDIMAELQRMAAEFGGHLEKPKLRWKFNWLVPILGWKFARKAQTWLPFVRSSVARSWDKTMYKFENGGSGKKFESADIL